MAQVSREKYVLRSFSYFLLLVAISVLYPVYKLVLSGEKISFVFILVEIFFVVFTVLSYIEYKKDRQLLTSGKRKISTQETKDKYCGGTLDSCDSGDNGGE
ncbi:hypothetical protein ACJJIL_04965 [Microbulbifer sp. EKSA005]|uniref:hypothetical protein n=1 Tax=Microbulbifer sp. EKSA005 TaxID=3243364 RepID=UPI0040431578